MSIKYKTGFLDSIKQHFKGGVKPTQNKGTENFETVEMEVPKKIILPMVQHLGAPCDPLVKKGEHIYVGQIVGDSDKIFSAPIHCGVSGEVTDIIDILLPGGTKTIGLVIASDGKQEIHKDIKAPTITSYDDFVKAVRSSGLVGLGGAGFPAHVKLSPEHPDDIDTLVINAAECEPFITSDYREMLENTDNIFFGIKSIMKWLNIDRAVIGIENNKPKAIKLFDEKLKKINSSLEKGKIEIAVLPAIYPQGAEKVLLRTSLNRIVPTGKLPIDVGALVMNVSSIGFLGGYLKDGMPLIKRRVTVAGSSIENPANVSVTIGTIIEEVFNFVGGFSTPPRKIFMGGPMMGKALMDNQLPVLKQNNAFLAISQSDVGKEREPSPCIRCGKCVTACPMSLTPPAIYNAYKQNDIVELKKLKAEDCMECGCCAYVCPAEIYLTQAMRMSRHMVRKAAWQYNSDD